MKFLPLARFVNHTKVSECSRSGPAEYQNPEALIQLGYLPTIEDCGSGTVGYENRFSFIHGGIVENRGVDALGPSGGQN